jgi:diaminohydroxyphosphoribosylaminopyrimidine deaminase / 5-amino-6-(5-phosphoribosylamino)uracil reductase
MDHTHWMHRCLQLARNGAGRTAPNPLVGAVLVQGDRVLAEGWHRAYGGPHAEVECLRAFGDGPVPEDAVMVVSLEPCAHYGRTPPCTDLLIARGVKQVVVAHADPFPEVSGRGIARMRAAGIHVEVGVCEAEARWTNRRFLTSVEQHRPFIILKWACSTDGFLDGHPRAERGVQRISSPATDVLVHRWRSEEQAILVGSRTVVNDDPQLTVRYVAGRTPLRIVIDRRNSAPAASKVFDDAAPTLLFTGAMRDDVAIEQVVIPADQGPLQRMMDELHERRIRSVLVEGGAELLGHFIARGQWDEARVITGEAVFGAGTQSPSLGVRPVRSEPSGVDRIALFTRSLTPDPAWSW